MEKRGRRLLGDVAERFDLPVDIVAGLPHLEMMGDREVYVEGHMGLLSYSEACIDCGTRSGILRITGQGLRLSAMTAEELRIAGRIGSVTWMEALP